MDFLLSVAMKQQRACLNLALIYRREFKLKVWALKNTHDLGTQNMFTPSVLFIRPKLEVMLGLLHKTQFMISLTLIIFSQKYP